MFGRVRTAVLSFILAFACASVLAWPTLAQVRRPDTAYNPSTGKVARVGAIREDGSLLLWSREGGGEFEGKAHEWVLSKTAPNPRMYQDYALKSMVKAYLTAEFEDGKFYLEAQASDDNVVADPSESFR